MMSKANKLPLETELVAHDNNTSWTLKPGHKMFVAPYSTDNLSFRYQFTALCDTPDPEELLKTMGKTFRKSL